MIDPLEALEDSLAYMFELQTKQAGKYIHPSVNKLKKALENYKKAPSSSLEALIDALKLALPVIDNYVEGYVVKFRMEALANANGLIFSWDIPSITGRRYPHFQFSAVPSVVTKDLVAWLSFRSGEEFNTLDSAQKVEVMITQLDDNEFMVKLGEYLRKNPDFLCDLILDSPKVFFQIIDTRLGFELEKQQIAKAIVHHCDFMLDNNLQPQEQIEKYVESLDMYLTKLGCSVEKLLNDPTTRQEFDKLDIFQLLNEDKLNYQF